MANDSQAFLDFVRPHWRELHLVAHQYVAASDRAHDLVQEVLMRAWRNFAPTDSRVYHRPWLFVIMRNVVAEWHRTASRRIRFASITDTELTDFASADPAGPFGAFPAMDEREFREFLDDRIAAALDALDAPFREVVILSVAGGLKYREIAEVLDCPIGTVMSRMARARRELRQQLAEFTQTPGHRKEVRP